MYTHMYMDVNSIYVNQGQGHKKPFIMGCVLLLLVIVVPSSE